MSEAQSTPESDLDQTAVPASVPPAVDDSASTEPHDEPATASAPETDAPATSQRREPVQVQVVDDNALAAYANFCRVSGTPEELIVDFGLNPQPVGPPKDPIHVNQRIILNHYTAKRLLAALQMSVARHEAVFGTLETDINKRVRRPS